MNRANARKTDELIRQQRTTIGMTQRMLADELNVTDKAISKWENGDGLPDISILIQLAAKLQITTDELLAGSMKKTEEINPENEHLDDRKRNEENDLTDPKNNRLNLIYLSLSISLVFYLALNQITSQFSSWFAIVS